MTDTDCGATLLGVLRDGLGYDAESRDYRVSREALDHAEALIAERDAAVARAKRAEVERDAWKERAKRRAALIRDMHELVAFRVGDPLTPRALAVLDAALADELLKGGGP